MTILSKIDANFLANGAREPRGILFRTLTVVGPGLMMESEVWTDEVD